MGVKISKKVMLWYLYLVIDSVRDQQEMVNEEIRELVRRLEDAKSRIRKPYACVNRCGLGMFTLYELLSDW